MKVVLDAKVLLRMMLPSPNPNRAVNIIFEAVIAEAFILLVADDLMHEVRRQSAGKPYLASRISPERTTRFIESLRRSAIELPRMLPPFQRVCRDDKDDYLLAYADAGRADYLITGDHDLLVLDGTFPFRIVSPPHFLTVLREQGLL